MAAADGLTSRMVQATQHLSVTDLPITCYLFREVSANPLFMSWGTPSVQDSGYTGRAAVSERERPGSLPLATA